jgi:hypothetical protein
MKLGTFAIAAGVLALGLVAWNTPSKAQGPLYDRVNVTLPYSISIGDRTLQPGDYVIQQLRSQAGGSRILLIYSDRGMKFETSAMTIPALENRTQEDTRVILHHFGPDYYFDKIWIQGKDYGYEFPLPDSVKARERERAAPVSVAASYSAVEENKMETADNTNTQTQTQTTETQTQTAQNTEPAPAPAPAPVEVAPAPAPAPAPEPAPAPAVQEQSSADRSMPATNAGWLGMLLGGGMLSSAGMMLRGRKK